MNRLDLIDKEELRRTLQARLGYKYDQAEYLIDHSQYLFRLLICDERVFKNLIPCTWVFKQDERPRTLEQIVAQLLARGVTWGELATAPPFHKAEWYQRIQILYDTFDWSLLGPVFVTPVKGWCRKGTIGGDELAASPTATFSIINGLHCSLAAATLIEQRSTHFRPVEAILVLPRLEY